MIFRVCLSLLLTVFMVVGSSAQQPTPRPSPLAQKPDTAADIDAQDVIRITTNLVQVDVVATKNGKLVTDLSADDFEIFEDGKPQKITDFSFVSNLPERTGSTPSAPPAKKEDRTAPPVLPARIDPDSQRRIVAVVIDDLGMSYSSILNAKKQIKKFIDTLAPTDLVAIVRTGGDVGALQQFTNDRRLLENAVDHLKWNSCSRVGIHAFAPAGMEGNVGVCSQPMDTTTLKSVRFILRGMHYLPGRKSMVLLSDNLPIRNQEFNSQRTSGNQPEQVQQTPLSDAPSMPLTTNYYEGLKGIAELATRSSVVIYAVDTRGLQTTGLMASDALAAPNAIGSNLRAMQAQSDAITNSRNRSIVSDREGGDMIATLTGGFSVRNSNDLELGRILEDQKGYYLLGFHPAEETFDRKFHHLKVRSKRSGLTIRSRDGFYGFTDAEARPSDLSITDLMNRALISPFGANAVGVRLSAFFLDDADHGPLLRSFVHVDAHDLTFVEEPDGSRIAKLDLRCVVFGDNGQVLDHKDVNGTLRLKGNQYERALREGAVYSFDLPIKHQGGVQFRVAVRDSGSARIGSAGQFIEVPDLQKGALAISGIFLRGLATESANGESDDVAGPAVRQFRRGSTVVIGYAIYKATSQKSATITTQMRVFREGKPVFVGAVTPVTSENQSDPRRIVMASALQLDSRMEPGEYIMQIIATTSSTQKPRTASQWIDFEVVK